MIGTVFYLEDDQLWIDEVKTLLGKDHDFYSARDLKSAATFINSLANQGITIDLAIVDISMIPSDGEDKQGFKFIDALERSGVLPGFKVIVLTGSDNNIRPAFRQFDVIDVFLKSNWAEEKETFKQLVKETILQFH